MIKINDLKLIDIAANSTLTDDTTRWIYESIDYVLGEKYDEIITKTNLIERLEQLGKEEIELLLWEFHVEGFNESMTLEERRILIAESLITHSKKGTVGVLKELITLLFGESKIEEWFSYGGEAGKFRIKTTANTSEAGVLEKFINLINETKNERSHLDTITYYRENKIPIYASVGGIINIHYKIKIGG